MGKTGALIEKKVKAFATGMEKRLTTLRKARVKEIDKRLAAEAAKGGAPVTPGKSKAASPTGEELVMKLTLAMSTASITKNRTGKQQAVPVAKGRSWTCAGSHMNDSARHIRMYRSGPGKNGKKYVKDPVDVCGTDDEHICSFTKFKSEWAAEMKTHDLRNYKTGKGYGDGDDYHLELPDSRIPKTDPECLACVDEYCRLVIMEGNKHNSDFEKNWASAIKAPMAKYKKEKEQIENAERLAELKAMQFAGKLAASGKLFSKATKTGKANLKTKGEIMPTADIIKEAGTRVPFPVIVPAIPKKGTFTDIYIFAHLMVWLVDFDNLSQTFVKEVSLDLAVTFKGVMSMMADFSADAKIDVALAKSGLVPTGNVTINYSVDGLGPDDHKGQIVYAINGKKTKVMKLT